MAFFIESLVNEFDAGGDMIVLNPRGYPRRQSHAGLPRPGLGDEAEPGGQFADGADIVALLDHLAEAEAHGFGHLQYDFEIETKVYCRERTCTSSRSTLRDKGCFGCVTLRPVRIDRIQQGVQGVRLPARRRRGCGCRGHWLCQ